MPAAETSPRPPRPASTVVVVRDAARGPQVFLVRRHDASPFMGGASVFPGGRVDPADGAAADASRCDGLDQAAIPPLPREVAIAHRVAAIRELFEEAGLLLARDASGDYPVIGDADAADRIARQRRELHDGIASLWAIAASMHLRLALDALVPFARWRTPPIDVRQFDAWFFLARVPPQQIPLADPVETTDGDWIAPTDALARAAAGDIALPPPTWTTLRELERFQAVDPMMAWAARRHIEPRQPRLELIDGVRYLLLPGDPLNPEPWHEPPPLETRFRLAPGRWPAERAEA